jgi:glutathione S-transferase|eukprot:m.121919 g.121919  ORF g.121919 m.121919 type:complete len:173 (-) comp21927_c0_seq1:79-597(-)
MKHKAEVGKTVLFPNLPYFIDGDVAISQSNAILRHVARLGGFLYPAGTPPTRVDFLLEQLADFDGGLTGMCYSRYDTGKDAWVEGSMKPGLAQFETLLGDDAFFGGATVCAADFKAYEEFDKCRLIAPGCLEAYPKLSAFTARVEAIPSIASYLKSDRFKARPLNNPHAQFK